MIEKKFLDESTKRIKTKEFIEKELSKAGIIDVVIQRTPISTRIGVVAERPGLVIGKKGKSIQDLAKAIEEKLGIDNPQIEVMDVTDPNQNPNVIARWIKRMLEKGMKPKRILSRATDRVMSSGAIGVEIVIKGSVAKGGRSRKNRMAKGYLKKAGDPVKLVKKFQTQAVLKQGVMGITVQIVPKGTIFPDKINIEIPETGLETITEETVPTPEETKAAEEVKEKAHETITKIAKQAKTDKKTEKLEKTAAKKIKKQVAKETVEETKGEKAVEKPKKKTKKAPKKTKTPKKSEKTKPKQEESKTE